MRAHENPAFLDALEAAVLARNGKRLPNGEIAFTCTQPEKHRNGDAKPSARWNRDKALHCCPICDIGGGAQDLAKRLGIPLPPAETSSRRMPPARPVSLAQFAEQRGLPVAVLERMRVKATTAWCNELKRERPCLKFPTPRGVARIKYTDGLEPKTRWAASVTNIAPRWYGLPEALELARDGQPLFIVNGEASAWACLAAGVPAICSCQGETTPPKPELIEELAAALATFFVVDVRVVFDVDTAGRLGSRKMVDGLATKLSDVRALDLAPQFPEGKVGADVGDLYQRVGDRLGAVLAGLPPLEVPDGTKANLPSNSEAEDGTVHVAELELQAPSPNGGSVEVSVPIQWERPCAWPTLHEYALHGLAGDIVHELAEHTEADPVALLTTLLTAFGNAVGSGPHMRVGGAEHPARLFAVLVGDTSTGRKGQSWSDLRPLLRQADDQWWEAGQAGGLASGEGLVARVKDAAEGASTDPRAFFHEPEFGRVLVAKGREGSTLSPLLRQAWDSGDLHVTTRKEPLKASGAHISLLGHVTGDELRETLTRIDMRNGLANRIMFMLVRRSQLLPDGGDLSDATVARLARALRSRIDQARRCGRMERTPAGAAYWRPLYAQMEKRAPSALGDLKARGTPYLLRLGLTFALLDGASAVDAPQIRAAHALWRYAEASAAYIFGTASVGNAMAERLLVELREVYPKGLDRTAQSAKFYRNRDALELAMARRTLIERGLAVERQAETAGRWATVLYAVPPTYEENEESPLLPIPEGLNSSNSSLSFAGARRAANGTAVRSDGMVDIQ